MKLKKILPVILVFTTVLILSGCYTQVAMRDTDQSYTYDNNNDEYYDYHDTTDTNYYASPYDSLYDYNDPLRDGDMDNGYDNDIIITLMDIHHFIIIDRIGDIIHIISD